MNKNEGNINGLFAYICRMCRCVCCISSFESQKGAINICKDVSLRTRRALSLYNAYDSSDLLVLNKGAINMQRCFVEN